MVDHPLYWFEDGFPQDAMDYILANGFPDASDRCQEEAARWVQRLQGAGFDVALKGGVYLSWRDGDEVPEEIGHAWVTVSGMIFDPTASQFADFRLHRDPGNYEDQVEYASGGFPPAPFI